MKSARIEKRHMKVLMENRKTRIDYVYYEHKMVD
jgi:hypothetical protein